MADEEKQDERVIKANRRLWQSQLRVDRRIPENAFIRRWFKLADRVLQRTDDSDKPKK